MAKDVIERIRRLLALMGESDVAELEVEEPELRIRIKARQPVEYVSAQGPAPQLPTAVPTPQPAAGEPVQATAGGEPDGGMLKITSPMVGTFYRAPSEGAEPYVSVGSIVEPDTVVCIVEAMKVMNEVKAEVSGEIAEVLVQNAEPVEFGQALFLVKPLED